VIADAHRLPATKLSELKRSLGEWAPDAPLVGCRLEPEPAGDVPSGARVAFFTTAPPEHEEEVRAALAVQGLDVRVLSTNLARRAGLVEDLARAERDGCDLYLTELKAAAIELVAEEAERRAVPLVFVRNRPVSLPGEPDLDAELLDLVERAREAGADETVAAARRR
jgi:cyclic 2,3-diphosphoglycerate synthase